MIYRRFGKTGLNVSAIGFGGIVVMNCELKHAKSIVAQAVSNGINYFDVAPSYGDAEAKLGPALKDFRKDVFLACKTGKRDRVGAKEELDASLKRLDTDYFDVYQLHAINDLEKDVETALSKDGAIQTLIEAKRNGIIRNIGFSSHSPEAAMKAMREFDFDTVMFPVNFVLHFRLNFENEVLNEANKRNMGIIAIKAIAKQKWTDNTEKKQKYSKCWYEPFDDIETIQLAINWTLQQKISLMLPPGGEKLFLLCMDAVNKIKNLSDSNINTLKNIANNMDTIF